MIDQVCNLPFSFHFCVRLLPYANICVREYSHVSRSWVVAPAGDAIRELVRCHRDFVSTIPVPLVEKLVRCCATAACLTSERATVRCAFTIRCVMAGNAA